MAEEVARASIYAQVGTFAKLQLLTDNPPREYAGPLPAYVVDYDESALKVYIDANSGQIVSVRTTKWRVFDVLWRFHIMDVTGADKFDTWWLKLASFLSLTMVLTGIVLIIRGLRRGTLLR